MDEHRGRDLDHALPIVGRPHVEYKALCSAKFFFLCIGFLWNVYGIARCAGQQQQQKNNDQQA